MLSLWTDNNRLLAPYMVMAATAIIAFALAYILMLVTRKRRLAKAIDEYSKGELRYLQAQITQYETDIKLLNDRIIYLKQKIAIICLHLGKAVHEAGINE